MSSVSKEGDQVVIRLSLADVHALRVALAPCPCKAAKSTGTKAIRERLQKALGSMNAG